MINSQVQNGYSQSHFNHQNVWCSLASQFRAFESKILNVTFEEPQQEPTNVEALNCLWPKNHIQNEIQQFEKQLKQKLCKILFQSSLNQTKLRQKQRQITEFQTKASEERQKNQKKSAELTQKIQSLEKLVKIYEKALSQSKNHLVLPQSTQQTGPLNCIKPINRLSQVGEKVNLKFDRIYSIKIQSDKMNNSISGSDLSYSRLSSSRMSSIRLDGGALKQLEKNWNKSVNLSNKSLKSANKDCQRSIQKEEKSFVKSHIKQRELNMSSIKEKKQSQKMNRQNRLNQSMISEFSLSKK